MNHIRCATSCEYWLVSALAKESGCALVGVASELRGSLGVDVALLRSALSSLCSGRPTGI